MEMVGHHAIRMDCKMMRGRFLTKLLAEPIGVPRICEYALPLSATQRDEIPARANVVRRREPNLLAQECHMVHAAW